MNLKEHYENLPDRPTSPKQELRNKLMAEFNVTEMTVYRWLKGGVKPEQDKWERISQITGIPVDKLFGETKKNEA